MTIRVTIERLVIDGIDVDARYAADLRRAVQARLIRLINRTPPDTEGGWPNCDRVDVTDSRLAVCDDPTRFGAQVADSIHQGMIASRRQLP